MAQLKALGGLKLEPSSFTQPKPLVLLSYLSLEGPKPRRHLAELFWPEGNRMKSLSMTLTRLRQGAGGVIEADDKQAKTLLACDARLLLESLDNSHWQRADELYTGAFLEGVVLEDWSTELEEWVYSTREYLAERVQHALLNLAEKAAQAQDFSRAGHLAERAYRLPGLSSHDPIILKRLYLLLCASQSLLARSVRKEAEGFELRLELNTDQARALFKPEQAPKTSLPVRNTSFVGRESECHDLMQLVQQPGKLLLSLVGTGGVGKTRLALQIAHELQKPDVFQAGVNFVSLESLKDAGLLFAEIAKQLNLATRNQHEPFEQVCDFLAKDCLLILDNFEHLSDHTVLLSDLLARCSGLKLLVTSRETLGLEEEHVFRLEGLTFPHQGSEHSHWDAVQLFYQRARQVKAQFDLNRYLPEVIRICQLVEGLPLGIELAASWLRLMSCADIASQIEANLEFLTSVSKNVPERHRSLRAVFESSWQRLSEKEQEVLRKLSVFRGGFRREAAAEVAGATIPILASLVDKSLLRVLDNGRYDRHPLLYQFTQEKLAELPEEKCEAESKHDYIFLHLAEQASSQITSKQRSHWFQHLDEELDNLRLVLERAQLKGNSKVGLQLLTTIHEFWSTRAYQTELSADLEWFLEDDALKHSPLYAKGLISLAAVFLQQGKAVEAGHCLQKARVTAEALDNGDLLSQTLAYLARMYYHNLGDSIQAESLYRQSIALTEKHGNKTRKASNLNFLANLMSEKGDFQSAMSSYEESLSLYRVVGHVSGEAWVLNNMASIFNYQGNRQQARLYFKQSLDLFKELGEKDGIATTLANLGEIHIRLHRYEDASLLLEESLEITTSLQDKRLAAYILRSLGQIAFFKMDFETAYRLCLESYVYYTQFGYNHGTAETLGVLGQILYEQQHFSEAESRLSEGLALARSSRDTAALNQLCLMLAILYLKLGNLSLAREFLCENLQTAKTMSSPEALLLSFEGYALLATSSDQLEQATLLFACVDTLRQQHNIQRDPYEDHRYQAAIQQLQQNLSHFADCYQQGKALSPQEAIALCAEL